MKQIEIKESEFITLSTLLDFSEKYIKNLSPKNKEQKTEHAELLQAIEMFQERINENR